MFFIKPKFIGLEKKMIIIISFMISFVFGLTCFSIFTFFLNKKILKYLIISLISIFFSIYLFEAYLIIEKKFSTKQDIAEDILRKKAYKKITGKKWDSRTKEEIYNENQDTVLMVAPTNYINKDFSIFPLSGISNSQTIYCNENGYTSVYKSDRYGFSNPDTEWDSKEIEYLIVGDSFAQGACVNRPNDIGSVLRKLSNKSVLNLGYGGNGPLIEYATLREYLNVNVNKVLWVYYEGNDFSDLNKELDNKFLVSYLNSLNFSQSLKLKQIQIDKLAKEIIEKEAKKTSKNIYNNNNQDNQNTNKNKHVPKIKKKKEKLIPKIIKFFKINNLRFLIFPPPEPVESEEFEKIIKLTKELVIKNNSELYFVYLPSYKRYKNKFNKINYNLVKNIVNELDIPFIDIHDEVFKLEENPLKLFPFQLPTHYNIDGYRKTSEAIYQLSKN